MSSSSFDTSGVAAGAETFPLTEGVSPRYGTAGFRGPAEALTGVAFRCGLVTALRCYSAKGDCGLVVTASHNPISDNGIKFVDFTGEVFPSEWEAHAEAVVDAVTPEDVMKACEGICMKEGIQMTQRAEEPYQVFVGHDSRPSSPGLLEAAIKGIKAMHVGIAFEPGLQTTPQVHFRVWRRYRKYACGEFQWLKYLSGGFMRMARATYGRHGVLTVDCANGVAAGKLKRLGECPGAVPQGYRFQLRNTGDGVLNVKCGAEYVQKQNSLPVNFESIDDWQRCASVDGDVDRVVYFTKVDNKPVILDGDRLAALAALHIQTLLDMNPDYKETYSFGVVLTAYSNGALVEYLKNQGIEVMIVPTGVKHLYAAAKKFHIGIFYEPNGHGSIIFSPRLAAVLRETDEQGTEDPGNFELLAVMDTMNQTIGDAVSNILMAEAVLRIREWTLQDWINLYSPNPSKTLAVSVSNKSLIKTDSTEERVLEPKKLQSQIDEIISGHPKGCGFVRASGTEDVVRIYAEGATQTAADDIAEKLSACVQKALKK